MLKTTKKIIWKILKFFFQLINFLLIWLTIFLTFVAIFKKEWIENFIEWMKIQVENLWIWNYVIAWISAWIEAIPVLWTMLPWQNILLLVWWFFWSVSLSNVFILILIASIWWIIWSFIWFFLWKIYWDTFFEKYWIWFWIWKTEVRYLEKWIKKWWPLWIILWKFHPITRSFLPFIAWSMKMWSWKFMIYNAFWSVFYAWTIVWIWVLFVEHYKIILEYIWRAMLWILILWWLYIYFYKREAFNKYMEEKNLEIAEMEINVKKKFRK